MKTPRYGHQTFVYSKKLWVVGGYTAADRLTSTAENIEYGSDNSYWLRVDMGNAYGRSFAVKRRLSEGSILSTGWVIGGGQFNDGSFVGSSATSVPTYIFTGAIVGFRNGPKLSTPRAMAKGIYVKGKTYISGNWQGDDSTMEVFEQGDTEFRPVGKTSGRMKPYMFTDSLGHIMVLSAYNTNGESFGYYTLDGGYEVLMADEYMPNENMTKLVGLTSFTSKNVLMMLPDDAKTEDYSITHDNGNHYHFMLSKTENGYTLWNFDMDERFLAENG